MGALSPTHWLIVLGVLVLLFGAKRLPGIARSVGQSTRVLKSEMRALSADAEEVPGSSPAAAEEPAEQPATVRVQ